MADVSEFKEAVVFVNGQRLTTAESMTLRVSLGIMLMDLDRTGLGEDDTGRAIHAGYMAASKSIFAKMSSNR